MGATVLKCTQNPSAHPVLSILLQSISYPIAAAVAPPVNSAAPAHSAAASASCLFHLQTAHSGQISNPHITLQQLHQSDCSTHLTYLFVPLFVADPFPHLHTSGLRTCPGATCTIHKHKHDLCDSTLQLMQQQYHHIAFHTWHPMPSHRTTHISGPAHIRLHIYL